jgi:hypothetical protein
MNVPLSPAQIPQNPEKNHKSPPKQIFVHGSPAGNTAHRRRTETVPGFVMINGR